MRNPKHDTPSQSHDQHRNRESWPKSGTSTHNFGTFVVKRLETAPKCEAGYVYGVSSGGQLQQIAIDGTWSAMGTAADGVSSFNGLGIGVDGQLIYAYDPTWANLVRI